MNSLDLVTAMARLSTRMAEAARANDWPLLAELEQQFAREREALAAREPDGRQTDLLSPAERQRKAALIQQILADGEDVLGHVQPVQDSVRRLLSAGTLDRSLRQAYAVGL